MASVNRTLFIALSLGLTTASCMGNRLGASDSTEAAADAERYDLAPLRRLTATQYANTITDLFGNTLLMPTLQVTDVAASGMATAGAAQVGIPASDAQSYTNAAASIARQVTGAAYQTKLGCTPQNANDAACAALIIGTWGKKIFRRPLTDAQQSAYTALAMTSMQGNFYNGIQAAMGAMLQSPYFLFRIDAANGAGTDPNAFDDYTLASRLSYLIWNSTPDDILLTAADQGALQTSSGLAAQADRMLQDPRANPALYNFFYEMLGLGGITTAQKNPNDFNAALGLEMQQQIQLTVTDVLLENDSDYRTLFTTPVTYVNSDMANLFGYINPKTTTMTRATYAAQDRAGLFGMPGMATMLSPSSRTSPTMRGEYIRNTLMCTTIPAAPPGVNTTVTTDPNTPQTMRQMMSIHASNPSCAACHNQMDPLGFALEDFDWMGRYRTTENGLPLDLTGTVDTIAFSNSTTLGAALARDPAVPNCLTQKFVAYATAATVASSDPVVTSLNQSFQASNYSIKALVKAYVLSNAFTHPL